MRRSALLVGLVPALIGCNGSSAGTPGLPGSAIYQDRIAGAAGADTAPPCAPGDGGGLTLPDGFCAVVAHEGVGPARHIAVAPNGDVYVALRGGRGKPGGVVALRDTTGDARFDVTERFGEVGGTGIAVRDGWLYFGAPTAIVRWRLPAGGGLAPTGAPDTVVRGFPEQRTHEAKPLAFDGRGHLFVNVGSPTNACQPVEQDRRAGVPGLDPCPQLARHGGVWRFDASRTGQTQADGVRWVTGTRNIVALAWNPRVDALYAVQHGRDQLNAMAPEHFTDAESAETPAEEFLRLDRGDDFGWPYCYYDPALRRRVLAPEYGGNGTAVGRCASFEEPLYAYPAHWAPNDLLFYTGRQFPERYRGGAFIAWHGSWNRAPLPQEGYRVTFQPMADGRPAGEYETFAGGFRNDETIERPSDAAYRPMGLAQAPDGSLYITETEQGRIWRVYHAGPAR